MRFVFLIVLLSVPAAAEEREMFYGTWGTPKQCARVPIKPGGTVLAEPFVIDPVGVRQGHIWCRLKWFPVETRTDGYYTGGHAHCSEDTVRDYVLRMEISGSDLKLRWGLFQSTGPLARCSKK